jgi:hypothetical protein
MFWVIVETVVMKSTVELQLVAKAQYSQIVISKVMTSAPELQLLSSEGINNHKLLHFVLQLYSTL